MKILQNFQNMDPVLWSIGNIDIRWYSLAYIFGIILGWCYITHIARYRYNKITGENINKFKDIPNKDILNIDSNIQNWIIIGVILGGRLGYVFFYNIEYYLDHPSEILAVWKGGMSFHGGFLGAALATYLYGKKNKYSIPILFDYIALAAPIGIFFGRIANFINGELYGRVTDSNMGIIFSTDSFQLYRHPSQIYEACLEGLVLFIILHFVYKKYYKASYLVSGIFCILYAIFRQICELFREPDSHIGYFANIFTMGQILSIPMICIGIILLYKFQQSSKEKIN